MDTGRILSGIGGFVLGVISLYSHGWVADHFKSKEETRKNIEKFMGKVTDVMAIATAAGYTNRQNREDRRRMDRAALQIERLGQVKKAGYIRAYMNKWKEVYELSLLTFKDGRAPFLKGDERRVKLLHELHDLTNKIVDSRHLLLERF